MAETITTEEAAWRLGVRVDEIYRLIRSGRLKAAKGDKQPRQPVSRWMVDIESVADRLALRARGRYMRDGTGRRRKKPREVTNG